MNRHPWLQMRMLGLTLGLVGLCASNAWAEMPEMAFNGDPDAGRIVATTRSLGNCVACHVIPGAESPGAIGPILIAIQTRYPSKEALARQIWDPTVRNPEVVMPPFGKHEILTPKEFVDVVEYIWSL